MKRSVDEDVAVQRGRECGKPTYLIAKDCWLYIHIRLDQEVRNIWPYTESVEIQHIILWKPINNIIADCHSQSNLDISVHQISKTAPSSMPASVLTSSSKSCHRYIVPPTFQTLRHRHIMKQISSSESFTFSASRPSSAVFSYPFRPHSSANQSAKVNSSIGIASVSQSSKMFVIVITLLGGGAVISRWVKGVFDIVFFSTSERSNDCSQCWVSKIVVSKVERFSSCRVLDLTMKCLFLDFIESFGAL